MQASTRLVVLGVIAAVVLAMMMFPVVGGGGLLAAQVSASESALPAELQAGNAPSATTVIDSTGKPIAYLYDQFRIPVQSAQISSAMKAAIVAIEDRRFFDHGGVDPVGTVRALVNDAAGGRGRAGPRSRSST